MLPPSLVAFDKGAEAVTANYSLVSGPATLTIIDYPTPQIAQAQENAIRAYLKAGSQAQPPWPKPLTDSDLASLEVRHSGPLVVVVSGDAIPDDSHRLLESVHYDADLTAIPQPVESEVQKTGQLLLGIAVLCVIGGGAAIFLGGFFGGGRAFTELLAENRPPRSTTRSSSISICGKSGPKERQQSEGRIRRVNVRAACGKLAINPKKHGEITANGGGFVANERRRRTALTASSAVKY